MRFWCFTSSLRLPILSALLVVGLNGCARPAEDGAAGPRPFGLDTYEPRPIGRTVAGAPWITHVTLVDLDGDGRLDVLACEGRLNQVLWLRSLRSGGFEEVVLDEGLPGPAHVQAVDFDQDGDLDLLVAGMGVIAPSTDRIGAVYWLENDGQQAFTRHTLLENVTRVAYVTAADLDGDGDLDLVVGHFGYNEGEIRWMERRGRHEFVSHPLLDLPGTIHAPAADHDGDGDLDIIALVSQNSEEIYAFDNDGRGQFTPRVLWGSTNKDYGSSGIALGDIDGDGDLDIAYTNGDGFDYATPGSRPWHGVQWLENNGQGEYTYHRLGDFPGSYSPVIADLDGDGDHDILAVSGFNDWRNPQAVAMVVFENLGDKQFTRHIIAHRPTHLIVAAVGDLDGDGQVEIVTGGLAFYGEAQRAQRLTLWKRKP